MLKRRPSGNSVFVSASPKRIKIDKQIRLPGGVSLNLETDEQEYLYTCLPVRGIAGFTQVLKYSVALCREK